MISTSASFSCIRIGLPRNKLNCLSIESATGSLQSIYLGGTYRIYSSSNTYAAEICYRLATYLYYLQMLSSLDLGEGQGLEPYEMPCLPRFSVVKYSDKSPMYLKTSTLSRHFLCQLHRTHNRVMPARKLYGKPTIPAPRARPLTLHKNGRKSL